MLFNVLVAAFLAVPASGTLAGALVQQSQHAGDHPAVKIIALLQGLQTQVKEEGQAEAVEYAAYTQWCTNLMGTKDTAIKAHKEEISIATGSIKALTADMEALASEIAEIETELIKDEAQKSNATEQRTADNTAFLAVKGDLEGTISAVGEAITALEANAPALTQKNSAVVKQAMELVAIYMPQAKTQVKAFLQRADPEMTPDSLNAPSQKEYDFKGGDIIDTLKQLKSKFENDLTEASQAEAAGVNSHTLADAAKQDEIDAATTAKETKTEVSGRKGQDKASAETDLTEATDALTSAQTVFDTTKTSCNVRAGQWDERTTRRAGEMKAMGEAMEVLEKITGVRAPADKGVDGATSFLQLHKSEDPRAKIVNLLRQASSKSKGKALKDLAKLADRIASLEKQTPGSGVFDSIKNMIQKMIFHLMSEQKDEDDHKNWCDLELSKTDKMIVDKNETRDALDVDIEALETEISTLSEGITANTDALALLATSMEEATTDRNTEKKENSATIKDAQDAQNAIDQAMAVLNDFYKSTGAVEKEAWELVQVRKSSEDPVDPPEPEPFSAEPYTGTDGGTGVIDLLTTVASDFASMESIARSDETTQSQEFDTFMTESHVDKAQKEKDSEMKEARKETMSSKLMSKTKDQDHNDKELFATNKYMENLQPACVNGDSSYEDRKAARTQETEALRNAQGILEEAFK